MKKTISTLLTLLLLMSMLTSCGASSGSSDSKSMAFDSAAEEIAEPAAQENSLTGSAAGSSTALPESRKWIITVNMSAETEDLDGMMATLDEKIVSLNGYVEDQRIYNGSTYSNRRYRNAYLTIRIPAEDVDSFTQEVSGIANVVSQEKDLDDVTLDYVATESRVTALETEEQRLLELMAQAETMSDLLEIEARLTDVRYELERYASQLRTYDNQIDYATIYLDIEEVQEYTPVEEPTVWERISGGFTDSLEGLGESLLDILVWVLANSPYLVVYGGIAAVIIWLVRRHRKSKGEKKSRKMKTPKHPWKTPEEPNEPEQK